MKQMKRWTALLLALLMLTALAACGKNEPEAESAAPADAVGSEPGQSGGDPSASAAKPALPPAEVEGSTTLMIYLLGSDLEAKAGAGTEDLSEIADSGVDLERCSVVVYAGGSQKWHNGLADKEKGTILELTDGGFAVADQMELSSMGEPECLSAFLNYSTSHYPAEHYALILWDHGSGPVIGYGKDMLYRNDTLTLPEMRRAMEASPFGPEQKLDWVGFDACLMASAELACVWKDYAEYLVASQEVEPAFGWAYSFLLGLGRQQTSELLNQLTDNYLDTCGAYYEKKGYEPRDTTLACLNLSAVPRLESAVEGLFDTAKGDLAAIYSQLTVSRVNARAPGRATTGSEYDLVDLRDLAQNLLEYYPVQAQELLDAVDEVVLINATNTEGLGGLSLYYPFFNKNYYESAWAAAYRELELFPSYMAYLEAYTRTWLGGDMLENYAGSETPEPLPDGTFRLQLTDEQAANFASARYHILLQEGTETYTEIFSSDNVTRSGSVLTANFDGNIIYGLGGTSTYFLPVIREADTVGSQTRYTVYANLTNDNDYGMYDQPSDYTHQSAGHRFHLVLNRETGEVGVNALLPYDAEVDSTELFSGKIEEPDLSQWTTYLFLQERHRTLTRYDNGAVMPVLDWHASDAYTASEIVIADGVRFLYKPLILEGCVLIFEICDTQGSRYCSEPIPIEPSQEDWSENLVFDTPEPITAEWGDSDSCVILDRDGIRISAEWAEDFWTGGTTVAFIVKNDTDRDICFSGSDVILNGGVNCSDGLLGSVTVYAHESGSTYSTDFGDAVGTGLVRDLESLRFTMLVSDCRTRERIYCDQPVEIRFTPTARNCLSGEYGLDISELELACRGAEAGEQTIYDQDGVRIELLRLGSDDAFDQSLRAVFRVENTGSGSAHLILSGLKLNDCYVPCSFDQVDLEAGQSCYRSCWIQTEALDLRKLNAISSISVCILRGATLMATWQGYGDVCWCPVTLSAAAAAPSPAALGDVLLYEDAIVRVCARSGASEDAFLFDNGFQDWYLTVENRTDEGISLHAVDKALDDTAISNDDVRLFLYDAAVGPHQWAVIDASAYLSDEVFDLEYWIFEPQIQSVQFRLLIEDFTSETLILSTDQVITLTVPNGFE